MPTTYGRPGPAAAAALTRTPELARAGVMVALLAVLGGCTGTGASGTPKAADPVATARLTGLGHRDRTRGSYGTSKPCCHGQSHVSSRGRLSARTAYRPPAGWYWRLNWLGVLLTSLGLAPRDAVTLQVCGRTTGKVRRVPILRTRYRGDDYLVALAGESQWDRNVRAARGHAVIRRRRARWVYLEELAPTERAEIIAEYLHAGQLRSGAEANADQARFYFGLDPEPSIDDIKAIADNYPVFRRITYETDDTHVTP